MAALHRRFGGIEATTARGEGFSDFLPVAGTQLATFEGVPLLLVGIDEVGGFEGGPSTGGLFGEGGLRWLRLRLGGEIVGSHRRSRGEEEEEEQQQGRRCVQRGGAAGVGGGRLCEEEEKGGGGGRGRRRRRLVKGVRG